MLTEKNWNGLATHIRSKLMSLYDPGAAFAEAKSLRDELAFPHKGFYIGIVDSNSKKLVREGFLREGCRNVLESAEIVVQNAFSKLKQNSIPTSQAQTATFHFCIITDVIYIVDPTAWDEQKDGVYFQWGQDYRALYLPFEIKAMNLNKIDLLDRLTGWEAGLASNLWRLDCGLIFKLVCHSYTS